MNARDWFNAQSFNGRAEKAAAKTPAPKVLTFDRWDEASKSWRHYRQDEDGTVTETDEIGIALPRLDKVERVRREMHEEGTKRYAEARLGAIDHGRVIRDMECRDQA